MRKLKRRCETFLTACILGLGCMALIGRAGEEIDRTYPVVDTNQTTFFTDSGMLRGNPPRPGSTFFGQDASYITHQPRYQDNRDGTITDRVTGLIWQKQPGEKMTFNQAVAGAKTCRTGGYDDWRLPSIKELYSLIDFNGNSRGRPRTAYLDTRYFGFTWGEATGGRPIDAQYWSATQYVGRTMNNDPTVFGVNFADGRIKGYPRDRGRRGPMMQYVKYVRGNPAYGKNQFVDNGDGTITDNATGLMWLKADSGKPMNWQQALAWCEQLNAAGHDDWRLPNAKELQSIVDYTRAPDATDANRRGPAIDPVFDLTTTESYFWTSTTHLEGPGGPGKAAAYIAFGRAMGKMHGRVMNVHGAGAQRSDPKSGDPSRFQGGYLGPQGDDIRVLNYVRPVRNIDPTAVKVVK